jgi:hemolysin III
MATTRNAINKGTTTTTPRKKAAFRGVSHQFAAVAAAVAGLLLTLDAPAGKAQIGCLIYTVSLTLMFTISATYHVPTWGVKGRNIMRKLDHVGIYAIIAGTYTPLCLLALDEITGRRLLLQVWTGAAAGIAHSLMSKGGPGSKAMSAILYIALGWIILPYARQLKVVLGGQATALVVAGGVIYSLGAVVYAARWPDPAPETFGYHEIFHAAVVVASALHFGAVRSVVVDAAKDALCSPK